MNCCGIEGLKAIIFQPSITGALSTNVSTLSKIGVLDKVLTKRLQQKAQIVSEILEKNNGDWEETAYQLLAKNFGFKLNSDTFLRH